MFRLTRPSKPQIQEFLVHLAESKYSYTDVGATASAAPRSYTVDHNRIRIGSGREHWERAVAAIRSWEMFNIGWIQLCWPDTSLQVGAEVAVLVSHFGFYSLNGARIVYLIHENEPIKRFGFAYGTLKEHAESGEERFTVEWNQGDDSVWYDLFAFSKPAHILSQLGLPLARLLQRRFIKDSLVRISAVVAGQ